jgi:hypothetical protein
MTCIYNVYALSIFFAHLKKNRACFFSQEFKVYFPIDVSVNYLQQMISLGIISQRCFDPDRFTKRLYT